MKFFGLELRRTETKENFETVLQRLAAAQGGALTGFVTPDSCMQSPTVHAIVTAISRRISVSPVHVFRKETSARGESKEKLPSHPVARLLQQPNKWQTRSSYWLDAVSYFVRHGSYHAFKSRGTTGPIRELLPLRGVRAKQDRDNWVVTYEHDGKQYAQSQIHCVRGPARDFLNADSPVNDVSMAITLEILAERFGAAFFRNGALPLLVFSFLAGNKGFKTDQDRKQFLEDFQNAFSGDAAFRGLAVPAGMDKPTTVAVENDKAQFLQTREYQRTVIAGAFGIPPHLVGAISPAFNVEQKDGDFAMQVVMPVAQAFEAAMERDLLTDEDRAGGIIIRFNLDSILRADFKSRQEGLRIQRDAGALSPNEWREIEGRNPISDKDGGGDYIRPANFVVAGEEPEVVPGEANPNSIPRN